MNDKDGTVHIRPTPPPSPPTPPVPTPSKKYCTTGSSDCDRLISNKAKPTELCQVCPTGWHYPCSACMPPTPPPAPTPISPTITLRVFHLSYFVRLGQYFCINLLYMVDLDIVLIIQ